MISIFRTLFAGVIAATLLACSDGSDSPQFGPYADEDLWLCKPGAASNRCLELDQTPNLDISAAEPVPKYEHNLIGSISPGKASMTDTIMTQKIQ